MCPVRTELGPLKIIHIRIHLAANLQYYDRLLRKYAVLNDDQLAIYFIASDPENDAVAIGLEGSDVALSVMIPSPCKMSVINLRDSAQC